MVKGKDNMYALIDPRFNNRICEIQSVTFDVAEPLTWVECKNDVTTEWTYDGLSFSKPNNNIENQFIGSAVLTTEQLMAIIVDDRNKRLAASDWTQLPDIPATVNKEAWAIYRQSLRDLPANVDVENPAFPVPPL